MIVIFFIAVIFMGRYYYVKVLLEIINTRNLSGLTGLPSDKCPGIHKMSKYLFFKTFR